MAEALTAVGRVGHQKSSGIRDDKGWGRGWQVGASGTRWERVGQGETRWERVAGGSEWDWEGVAGSRWERVAGGSEWD